MSRLYALLAPFLLGLLSACQDHKTYKQLGTSMAPTILAGENVFIDEGAYLSRTPQRADVIVIRPPAKTPVGSETQLQAFRIIGLPGDTLTIQDDALCVNGSPATYQYGDITGSYARIESAGPQPPAYPVTVTEGHYFVCSDNTAEASDSRHWGLLPADAIVGQVIGK